MVFEVLRNDNPKENVLRNDTLPLEQLSCSSAERKSDLINIFMPDLFILMSISIVGVAILLNWSDETYTKIRQGK